MLTQIFLPLWALFYLLLVLTVFVISFFTDHGKERKFQETYGSVLSLMSICMLVIALFNPFIAGFLGFFVFPITFTGLYWEYSRAEHEIIIARGRLAQEIDLDEEEREFLLNVAMALNALIVVPGYIAGIILCFNMISALF